MTAITATVARVRPVLAGAQRDVWTTPALAVLTVVTLTVLSLLVLAGHLPLTSLGHQLDQLPLPVRHLLLGPATHAFDHAATH